MPNEPSVVNRCRLYYRYPYRKTKLLRQQQKEERLVDQRRETIKEDEGLYKVIGEGTDQGGKYSEHEGKA